MLKIKLSRTGRKGIPFYRIVVNEAKTRRDGKYVENLGFYNPAENPKVLELDVKKYEEWVKKGAQPTITVAALYAKKTGKKAEKTATKAPAKATEQKEAKAEK